MLCVLLPWKRNNDNSKEDGGETDGRARGRGKVMRKEL